MLMGSLFRDVPLPQMGLLSKVDKEWKPEWASDARPWAIINSENVADLTADPFESDYTSEDAL